MKTNKRTKDKVSYKRKSQTFKLFVERFLFFFYMNNNFMKKKKKADPSYAKSKQES